jgi:hypothetical protein
MFIATHRNSQASRRWFVEIWGRTFKIQFSDFTGGTFRVLKKNRMLILGNTGGRW